MKKITPILLALSLLSSTTVFAAQGDIDRIVAVVNSDVITLSELTEQTDLIKRQMTHQNQPIPAESVLRNQMLQRMIDVHLQLQLAERAGVVISDQQIDQAIENIGKHAHLDLAGVKAELAKEHLSYSDYRTNLRKELIISELQKENIAKNIQLTDDDVATFLKSHQSSNKEDLMYNVQDLVVPLAENPTSNEVQKAKAHAESLLKQLHKGADFKSLAQQSSTNRNALSGGDLGWRRLAELPDAFSKAIVNLKDGGIAGPIRAGNGFHLLKLQGKKAGSTEHSQLSKEQARELVFRQRFEERVSHWLEQLRSRSYVKVMLDTPSHDNV